MDESLQLVGKIFVQNLKQYKSERLRDLERRRFDIRASKFGKIDLERKSQILR